MDTGGQYWVVGDCGGKPVYWTSPSEDNWDSRWEVEPGIQSTYVYIGAVGVADALNELIAPDSSVRNHAYYGFYRNTPVTDIRVEKARLPVKESPEEPEDPNRYYWPYRPTRVRKGFRYSYGIPVWPPDELPAGPRPEDVELEQRRRQAEKWVQGKLELGEVKVPRPKGTGI
jgi:hypothetical protein